jgi:hypothetical protein
MELTKEQAIAMAQSGWWLERTAREIVDIQLYEDRLTMDFSAFHRATEEALGRPVFSHEFARPDLLIAELEGRSTKATFAEVMDKLPKGKPVILAVKP